MSSTDIETYCEDGVWKNRWLDSRQPFSTGTSRRRQLAIGAEAARWNQARHVIRDADGAIREINVYAAGPYPSRSPIRTIRYGGL
ncbi:MAG TPA: DUF2188 domain-containing protein [Kribbella sp.]